MRACVLLGYLATALRRYEHPCLAIARASVPAGFTASTPLRPLPLAVLGLAVRLAFFRRRIALSVLGHVAGTFYRIGAGAGTPPDCACALLRGDCLSVLEAARWAGAPWRPGVLAVEPLGKIVAGNLLLLALVGTLLATLVRHLCDLKVRDRLALATLLRALARLAPPDCL